MIQIRCHNPQQGHASMTNFDRAEKKRAYNRDRYAANSDRIKAQVAEYKAKNPEKVRLSNKAASEKNKDRIKAYQAEYREARREKAKEYARAYRAGNPDKYKAAIAAWYAAHPGAMKVKRNNRRARTNGMALSIGIVSKLMTLQRGLCAECKCNLEKSGHHIDHIIPLAKDGRNTDCNVQLLCPPCNLRKSSKDPIAWAQENGRLL